MFILESTFWDVASAFGQWVSEAFGEVFTYVGEHPFITIFLVMFVSSLFRTRKGRNREGRLKVIDITKKFDDYRHQLSRLGKLDLKKMLQEEKDQEEKEKKRKDKNIYVINFKGNVTADHVANLRECVNAILLQKDHVEKVIIKIESPGGSVAHYGLCYSQINRLKEAECKIQVCIDLIGASGGFLMSLPAQTITAAPCAFVGSIGVVATFLNFFNLLKKWNIEPVEVTAGKSKRTLTPIGQMTEEKMEAFKEELESIHEMFKQFVKTHREGKLCQDKMDEIFSGKAWTAQDAKVYGLVDEIKTSDDVLMEAYNEGFRILKLEYKEKMDAQSLLSMLAASVYGAIIEKTILIIKEQNKIQ